MRNRTLISRAEGGGLPFTFHEHICIWTGRLSEYLRVYSMALSHVRSPRIRRHTTHSQRRTWPAKPKSAVSATAINQSSRTSGAYKWREVLIRRRIHDSRMKFGNCWIGASVLSSAGNGSAAGVHSLVRVKSRPHAPIRSDGCAYASLPVSSASLWAPIA